MIEILKILKRRFIKPQLQRPGERPRNLKAVEERIPQKHVLPSSGDRAVFMEPLWVRGWGGLETVPLLQENAADGSSDDDKVAWI